MFLTLLVEFVHAYVCSIFSFLHRWVCNKVDWSWVTRTNDGSGHDIYAKFNSPGVYNIQVSARSKGHTVDRMALYKETGSNASKAQNLSTAVTSCSGGTPPPPPTGNPAPTVDITSPSNNQQFQVGTNVTVRLNSDDSNGSVTKHEIFLDNSRVSNQGGNYTPFVLRNLTTGNHAIKAKVTDNGGKTATTTVNINVSGNTPPPPPP